MKRRSLLLAMVLLLQPLVPRGFAQTAPAKLTLKEAERMAIANHPLLRAAELNASAANEATTEARSAYYPFAYGSLSGAKAENNSRIAAGGLSNPIILNRYSNGVTVGQLVTDFGRTYNLVQSSRLRAEAEKENVTATRADVLLGVDRSYFELLRTQAVLKVAVETVSARQLVDDRVRALEQSKLKSGLDVSFANVNLSEAKLLLVQAQNDLQAAQAEFSAALGMQTQENFELQEELLPAEPPPDLAPLIEQAFRNRPDLAAQQLDADAAQRFATAERDLWFPSISWVGGAGLTPFHQNNLTDRYAAAGFNVSIPIFNGRLFSARHAEASYHAQAATKILLNLRNRVARDVRVAWLQANSAYQRLDLTAQLLGEATEAFHLAEARYKLGLSAIVELSQAQLTVTQAEIEQARAKYEYQRELANLHYQTGILR
jgi:outer membrane protein